MSEKVKLHNTGKRKIYYTNEGHHIAPKESIAFEPETAAKLKALYPTELLSLDDVRDQFDKDNVISVDQATKERNEAIAIAVEAAVKKALEEERARAAQEDEIPEENSSDAPKEEVVKAKKAAK